MLKIIIILLLIIWFLGSTYVFVKTWKQTDIMLLSKIIVIVFWPVFIWADIIKDLKNRKKKNETEAHINNETSTDRVQNEAT